MAKQIVPTNNRIVVMSWITLLCMQIQLLLLLRLLNLLPMIILAPLVAVVAKLQFLTSFFSSASRANLLL